MHLLPVIVVSGHAKEHEDIVRAFQAGANDFVRKPLGQFGQDLSAKIDACLERAGRHSHVACLAEGDEIHLTATPARTSSIRPTTARCWFRGELLSVRRAPGEGHPAPP